MTRDAAVQRWPEVPNADQTMPSTARSRSASSRTMIAFLPPSSTWRCLSRSAAAFATVMPVSREPVNVMTGTSGWRTSAAPASSPKPWTMLTTPSGMPASSSRSTKRLRERGRVLRRLDHDGVPADERRDRLPRRDRDREVPRRDRADDADRHADAHVPLVLQLGRRRVAEEAPALAGHVVRDVDRLLDVAARLGLDLPHLVRDEVGERGLLALEDAARRGRGSRRASAPASGASRRTPPSPSRPRGRRPRRSSAERSRSSRRRPGSCSRKSRSPP